MEANYFTILYWFCHTSTWIWHRCTHVPHPEPPSHLPPCTFPRGRPSAPALSILYHTWNLDQRFISHMILYMVNNYFYLFILNFILFLNFTILYWFCQISKWIHHRYTCVPHPEPSSLLPPPSPYHPSGSSQCTSPKHPVSCIEPGLATRSIYDIIHTVY